MNDCVFCKIVSGEILAQVVYEDEKVLAFLNIEPSVEGHVLVIPKNHSEEFLMMESGDYEAVMGAVKLVAAKIKKVYQPKRVGLLAYGFDVAHTHLHVLPIISGGEIKHSKGQQISQEELESVKEKLTK